MRIVVAWLRDRVAHVAARRARPIGGGGRLGPRCYHSPASARCALRRRRMARPARHETASRRARLRAFTLIEVMVVIVILGILAALIVPRVMTRPDEARVIAARQDIASIMQALKLYRLDNQRYPTTEQGLQALVTRPTAGPEAPNWKAYLDRMPVDPWGKPYQYLSPGVRGEIDVFSLGADGQPGGSGVDADIGSWGL
jgi:general secretion pathway protein G